MRLTNRQNVVFRGLTEDQLPVLYERLTRIGMAEPGAELARDVVACPGADTCNLAVTQSRGLAKAIGDRLEEEGLADVGGVRINISGCTNSCGQHHAVDIGFFGVERAGPRPGRARLHDAARRLRRPGADPLRRQGAAAAGEDRRRSPRCGWSGASPTSGARARPSARGSIAPVAHRSSRSVWPTSTSSRRPPTVPDFYVDYGETGPYVKEIGESECAT